jgi:hypothetical protein
MKQLWEATATLLDNDRGSHESLAGHLLKVCEAESFDDQLTGNQFSMERGFEDKGSSGNYCLALHVRSS